MTFEECIDILSNEKECVRLAAYCDRKCEACALVRDPDDIIEALDKAIRCVNHHKSSSFTPIFEKRER